MAYLRNLRCWMLITLRCQSSIDTEAESGQLAFVVHNTVRDEVIARHGFRNVVPIVLS